MSSIKDYQKLFNDFESDLTRTDLSACAKLDNLTELVVNLDLIRPTYWAKPCIKHYWCLWDQDHSAIDDLKLRALSRKQSLVRQCEVELMKKQMEDALQNSNKKENIYVINKRLSETI